MCAHSRTVISGVPITLNMGYWGGTLKVGNTMYTTFEKDWRDFAGPDRPMPGLKVLAEALMPYSKAQLIGLLASLVDNATEG